MTNNNFELRVRFDQLTPAKANVAARELQLEIRRLTGSEIQTELRKSRNDTQDLGTILAIILEAPATTAIATHVAAGIGAFIARFRTKVIIETEHGRVVFTGDATKSADLEAIARVMCQQRLAKSQTGKISNLD